MITFAFTPVGANAVTPLALLESDRYWPAEMNLSAEGVVQVSLPVRAATKEFFGRGLRHFDLQFPVTRQHANLFAAVNYILTTIPPMQGARGTLTIALPSGGVLRAVNCVCQSATGRYLQVRSYCSFHFVGPSIGP